MGLISRIKDWHHCPEAPQSNLLVVNNIRLLRYARNDGITIMLLLFSLYLHATIHTVKQDGSGNFTTIQLGINTALTGDTVLVWPGIYFENINYSSKSITVASLYLATNNENYIYTTIIDGGNIESCVAIINCAGISTTLCGFTIQHGSGYSNLKKGGGIYINESSVTIEKCLITNNNAWDGGGIYCRYSNVLLSGCTIRSNIALVRGGGLFISFETIIEFDEILFNSIYLNHSGNGMDIASTTLNTPSLNIVLDTFTVQFPDSYFIFTFDNFGYPVNNYTFQANESKIQSLDTDLYVSPTGNNSNSGTNVNFPLKTISYALKKILPDSTNPKYIHLMSGIYSSSTNGEQFPISQRSFLSLQGSAIENAVIDGENLFPLYFSTVFNQSFSIENLQFTRGIDSQTLYGGCGGLEFVDNDGIRINNININETKGSFYSALTTNKSNILISNSKFFNNSGGYPLAFFNSDQNQKQIELSNTKIYNNGPGSTYEEGKGGAVGFVGSYSYPDGLKGTLTNILISNNSYTGEPGAMNFGICGLSCANYSKVDVINTTIGNNIVTNTVNSAQVYVAEGAEINFFNSVVYGIEDYEIFLGDGQPTSYVASINLSNTNVKGGEENIQNWNNIHVLNWLNGNIDENPLYTGLGDDPYSLQASSPCIDAGTPMFEEGMDYPYIKENNNKYILYMLDGDTVTLPATDLAGNPRISGNRIDMGAYEWQDTATIIISLLQSSVSELSISPNPFTSNTFISFKTTKEHFIAIKVLNLKGQLINTITENKYPGGTYRLVWDGHDNSGFPLHSGTYLICLYSNGTLNSIIKANKINPR